MTPIYSILEDKADILEDFKKLGSDINQQDSSGNTPLLFFAQCYRDSCVKKILSLGADPNIPNSILFLIT